MIQAAELAATVTGMLVSMARETEVPIPTLGYTNAEGKVHLSALYTGRGEPEDLEYGRHILDKKLVPFVDAALAAAVDVTIGGKKSDAIQVELRTSSADRARAAIAIRYAFADGSSPKVFQPLVLEWKSCNGFDKDQVLAAFLKVFVPCVCSNLEIAGLQDGT